MALARRWPHAAVAACAPALLVLLLQASVAGAAKVGTPRFKWGQNKEQIFLSVIVRDFDASSVAVSLPGVSEFKFRGKSAKGEDFSLDLDLREDIKPETLKWEVMERSDKWGTAVLCIFGKVNEHRWDLLVMNPKKYKGIMDKDWTREDQTLEPEEELPYVEDNAGHLIALTGKNYKKTIAKFSTVVLNVRYPWCSQCKTQDETFAKTAKTVKTKGKKDAKWKSVAFAVLDAREEKKLADELGGAKCEYQCEYHVFSDAGEEPTKMKSQFSEPDLLASVAKYTAPVVQVLSSASDVDKFKETNITCLGQFADDKSASYAVFKKVAGMMRGDLVFAVLFGQADSVQLWPQNQTAPYLYDGSLTDNGTSLHTWMKPRSMPLLQAYDWNLRETYEKLGLPIAKVYVDETDTSLNKMVRHVVKRVAKQFLGKIAFVENRKSSYSYELRDFGLNQPEVYPAFGIASNASYTAIKFGFEITKDIAPSPQDFWKDADVASDKLSAFCEQVLAGTWPEAHETGTLQTNWTEGTMRHFVWKDYKEMKNPEKPLLLSVYGKYRAEHERKAKEAKHLATVLNGVGDFVVAGYDTSDNYFPPDDFKRQKFVADTEWYWVPAANDGSDDRPPMKKLMKPKVDAPIKNVVEFAIKSSNSKHNVEDIMAKFEKLMQEDPPPSASNEQDIGDIGDDVPNDDGVGNFGSLNGAEL